MDRCSRHVLHARQPASGSDTLRRLYRATFIDFHLVVPREMSTGDAHVICDRMEGELKKLLPGAVITIQVEPEDKAKHEGIPVI